MSGLQERETGLPVFSWSDSSRRYAISARATFSRGDELRVGAGVRERYWGSSAFAPNAGSIFGSQSGRFVAELARFTLVNLFGIGLSWLTAVICIAGSSGTWASPGTPISARMRSGSSFPWYRTTWLTGRGHFVSRRADRRRTRRRQEPEPQCRGTSPAAARCGTPATRPSRFTT